MPVMCVGMSMVECALFPEEGNMASAEAEDRGNVDLWRRMRQRHSHGSRHQMTRK